MQSKFNDSFAYGLNDTNIWTTSCKSMRTRCWLFFKFSPLSTTPCQQRQVFSGGFHGDLEAVFSPFHFIFWRGEWQIRRPRKSLVCWGFCKACCGATIWCFWNKSLTTGFMDLSGQIPVPGWVLVWQKCSRWDSCDQDHSYHPPPMHYEIVIPLALKPFSEKQPLSDPEQLQHCRV